MQPFVLGMRLLVAQFLLSVPPVSAQPLDNEALARFIHAHETTHLRRSPFETAPEYESRIKKLERQFLLRFRWEVWEPIEPFVSYNHDTRELTVSAWMGGVMLTQEALFGSPLKASDSQLADDEPLVAYQLFVVEQYVEDKDGAPSRGGSQGPLKGPKREIKRAVFFLNEHSEWDGRYSARIKGVSRDAAQELVRHIEFRLYGVTAARSDKLVPRSWPHNWVMLHTAWANRTRGDDEYRYLMPARLNKLEFIDVRDGKVWATLMKPRP